MVVLDTAIANVSLRYIAGSLAVSVDESTWIVTTYLIANAVILPISGWLSNVIGRKRFYMICVAVFTVASLLCGLATSLTALIVFRILQGLGGGGMPTSEQAMLADTFPPQQRPQAFAHLRHCRHRGADRRPDASAAGSPTIIPGTGSSSSTCRSASSRSSLVQWLVVEPEVLERERAERLAGGLKIDWVGFALIALTFGSLEFVLDRGQIEDWFHSTTIVIFATISACSFIFFIPWELTHDDPIVDIRLLCQRQFGMAFIVMLAVGAILFGSNQITPQLMQTNFPYTAMLSGLAMMPGGMAMLVMMPHCRPNRRPRAAEILDRHRLHRSSRWRCGIRPRSCPMRALPISRRCASFRRSACRSCSFRSTCVAYTGLPQQKTAARLGADQCRAQSRRQHQRVARQHRIGATLAISSGAAG